MISVAAECGRCHAVVVVRQIQGDRCPGCNAEFKYFAPGEEACARDYFQALTGWKSLDHLPDDAGFVISHE